MGLKPPNRSYRRVLLWGWLLLISLVWQAPPLLAAETFSIVRIVPTSINIMVTYPETPGGVFYCYGTQPVQVTSQRVTGNFLVWNIFLRAQDNYLRDNSTNPPGLIPIANLEWRLVGGAANQTGLTRSWTYVNMHISTRPNEEQTDTIEYRLRIDPNNPSDANIAAGIYTAQVEFYAGWPPLPL